MKVGCDTCKRNTVRESWKSGAWDNEPNVNRFEHAGLVCIIHRGPGGHWCGYVGVEAGHPLFGNTYNGIEEDIHVHGDLTYSDGDFPGCIALDDGKKRWWFGFNCAHAGDVCPAFLALGAFEFMGEDRYWTMEEVIKETEHLADQISKVGSKNES